MPPSPIPQRGSEGGGPAPDTSSMMLAAAMVEAEASAAAAAGAGAGRHSLEAIQESPAPGRRCMYRTHGGEGGCTADGGVPAATAWRSSRRALPQVRDTCTAHMGDVQPGGHPAPGICTA